MYANWYLIMANQNDDNNSVDPDDIMNPDHVETFRIPLGYLRGEMKDLTQEEQSRQIGQPFEKFGLWWLLTIERIGGDNCDDPFDVFVVLYCLSVENDPDQDIPLWGDIKVGEEVYNAGEGRSINMVGMDVPAHALKLCPLELRLTSNQTKGDIVEVPMDELGSSPYGMYDRNWRGCGTTVLRNHKIDIENDHPTQTVVKLKFNGTVIKRRNVD